MTTRQAIPVALISALVLVLGWMLWFWEPGGVPDRRHQLLEAGNAPPGGDFVLQSWAGPVALSDLRGKVVLMYFGYTWCPDICPTSLALMSAAFGELQPEQLERVQGLFVSVDPARDTTQRLKEYGAYFHPSILGVTGSEETVA